MAYPVSLGVHFYVTNSVTGAPVAGATCKLTSQPNGAGEGATGVTDAAGYAFVALLATANWWQVMKSGYVTQSGNYPPLILNVALVPGVTPYAIILGVNGSGVVSATVNGSAIDPALVNYAPSGSALVVTATPAPGNYLKNWLRDSTQFLNPANPLSLTTPPASLTVYAIFEQSYTVTIVHPVNGSTNPPEGTYAVSPGSSFTVTAAPAAGYVVDHWNLRGTPTGYGSGSLTFNIVDVSTTVEVLFKLADQPPPPGGKYTLVVIADPPEGGTVTGAGEYDPNARVVITATAAANYTFDHWLINGVQTIPDNPATVTVDRDNYAAVAIFTTGGNPGGWPVTRKLTLFSNRVLQASQWETGKSTESVPFNIGDPKVYLGASLEYTAQYLDGNSGANVGILLNGQNIGAGSLGDFGDPPSLHQVVDVGTLLLEKGNIVTVGHDNHLAFWSKVGYTVVVTLGYSATPDVEPGGGFQWPVLEWWQWGMIGAFGLGGLYVLTRGRGGGQSGGGITLNLGERARSAYSRATKRKR